MVSPAEATPTLDSVAAGGIGGGRVRYFLASAGNDCMVKIWRVECGMSYDTSKGEGGREGGRVTRREGGREEGREGEGGGREGEEEGGRERGGRVREEGGRVRRREGG